ncbi:FecR family protein [Luteimonas aquatica]|uniref:FecR family protein n=1 Tax=Luteimonas aquatica TaxID=450364 RepID=UPI001F59DCC4|nr:FecR domain-containing protein [Luteimonas aquatica]
MDSRQIEQAAADWLARRGSGAWRDQDQARLQQWLEADNAHRVAFLRLENVWTQSGRLKALGAGCDPGTIPERGIWRPGDIDRSRRPGLVPARPRAHWPRRAGLLFLLAIVVGAGYGWRQSTAVARATYESALGDLRSLDLADGSEVVLSSDSRVDVALSRQRRQVRLERGEALFEVAKDRERPFMVEAGGRRVTAVGTRFSVRREGGQLRVIVTEGRVRLARLDSGGAEGAEPPTLLSAGSIALAGPDSVLVRRVPLAEAERQLDWRNGYLSFEDASLREAAAEFNRYNRRKLVIADEAAAELRVGGRFHWSNTDAFVRLLEQGFPIRAVRRTDRVELRSR